MTTSKVGILGGGGFGLALARAVVRTEREVVLWSRRQVSAEGMSGVTVAKELGELAQADLIFLSVPSVHAESQARALGAYLDGRHLLVHVSRGLVGPELRTVSRVLREVTPARRVGCLAGPLDARALAEGTPNGTIVGSAFPEVAEAVRAAIGGPTLRVYETEDVIGVEVSSALVGLLALLLGFARELGIGPGALAVMMTRGMNEAERVGVSLGAEAKTFAGLAGAGDLLSAALGDDRPESKLGAALARGLSRERAGIEAGAHIEGLTIARNVQKYAARRGIDVPITEATADALDGNATPSDVIARLMSRRVKRE